MKRTLLFIGHHFHSRTKSNRFMMELIEREFEIETCSVVPDCVGDEACMTSLRRKHYDVVLCWQVMPSIETLKRFCSFDFGVFFPMADYYYLAAKDVSDPIWREYQDFQIISFSRKMHDELAANGFSSHYFQYFPEPATHFREGDADAVFFWQRVSHINIYTVLSLLKNWGIRRLHFHRSLDPGETYFPLPYEHQGKLHVTYSSWFDSRDDMLRRMDESALYVASRYCEGIGMSFLEAMAHGRCVIAPDETTFNEYIEDGRNGLLFRPACPRPLNRPEIRTIQKNAYEFIREGYREWKVRRNEIVPLFTIKASKDPEKIRKLETVWRRRRRITPAGDNPLRSLRGAPFGKMRKYMDIVRNRSGGYHRVSERKFCGIRWFIKMERNDRRRIFIIVLGIPLFSVDFQEDN